MKGPFQKRSQLDDRIRRLDRNLADLERQIRALSKTPSKPAMGAPDRRGPTLDVESAAAEALAARLNTAGSDGGPEAPKPPRRSQPDHRFKNYLASSFRTMHPLRQERRIQRNKAIMMLVFVALIIILLVCLLRS